MLVGVGGVPLEHGVDIQISLHAVDDTVRDVLDTINYGRTVDDSDGPTAEGVTFLSTAFDPSLDYCCACPL